MASAPPSAIQLQQQNNLMRQAVVANSLKMKQQIFSGSFDPASQNIININPRLVGLLLGFIVEVTGEVTNTAGGVANRTRFGNANMLSQIRFDDLSNYTRIQVPGWHLATLNSARQGFGYGGVYANNIPMGYGVNYDVYQGSETLAASAVQSIRQQYYVPVSYSATDLRGAIYAAVVNATMNLQLTINQTPFDSTGNDSVSAIYQDHAGAWSDDVTVTVWQVYLDQIPRGDGGAPILPFIDLNTVYDLKQTTFSAVTANQDFPMAYANFRSFISTMVVYDNGGELNAGTDVNYFSLAAANFTNIWRIPPSIAALDARMTFMSDVPAGSYWFESRDMPVNTINYGNMELNLNASVANAGARCLVGYESFAQVNQLVGATSLAGG